MSASDPTVFMIGWEYPPNNSGGLGVACEGLTKALAAQNTQVYFTLPYQPAEPTSHLKFIPCVDASWGQSSLQPPFSVYDDHTSPLLPSHLLSLATPTSELERKVDQYSNLVVSQATALESTIDVIHAHDWMTFPAATKIAHQTGKPLIAHIHSTEFDRIQGGNGSRYIHQQEYDGMQQADRVIVVSNYTKHVLIHQYGINPQKIDVVHNGIQTTAGSVKLLSDSQPTFARKRPVVVFMGRLTYQKGAEYFLNVARMVLASRPDTLFVIAGDGDLYYQLLISTAGQALSASVVFAGFIRGKEKDQLLQRATVFMMPSLSEPFGLVALEAAQQNTPVIVSKTAGVSEVMPSAVAIDFWDVQVMSRTLLGLLADPKKRQTIVDQQLQDLRSTSWQKAALNVKEVYRKAFLG